MKIFLFVSGFLMLSAGTINLADLIVDLITGRITRHDDNDLEDKQQVNISTEKKEELA